MVINQYMETTSEEYIDSVKEIIQEFCADSRNHGLSATEMEDKWDDVAVECSKSFVNKGGKWEDVENFVKAMKSYRSSCFDRMDEMASED